MKYIIPLFTIVTFLFITTIIFGQSQSNVTEEDLNEPPVEVKKENYRPRMTQMEFNLSRIVLMFGISIITLEMLLVWLNKIDSQDAIKIVIITLIVTSTLFLITAGYSNDQIAPAMGLLGTIAGYLLGKQKT